MPDKVLIVSYPRSGHHLLVDTILAWKPVSYCKTQSHCGRVPCPDPETVLQKHHDFDLSVRRGEGWKTLVQMRSPLASLVSFYEWSLKRGSPFYIWRLCDGPLSEDTMDAWQWFALTAIFYWRGFAMKWLPLVESGEAEFLAYERLTGAPSESLAQAIRLMGEAPPEPSELAALTRHVRPPESHRDIAMFRHYDAGFFARLEGYVSDILAGVPVPRYFPNPERGTGTSLNELEAAARDVPSPMQDYIRDYVRRWAARPVDRPVDGQDTAMVSSVQ